jgi:hypothetical protein
VLVVGDSLAVGGRPTLEKIEPDVMIDAEVGRPSSAGVSVLRGDFAGQDVVVFDLGTNDDPTQTGALVADLQAARGIVGDRCLVVATINRPPANGTSYEATNGAIESFALRDGNTQVVPWLLATQLHPEVVYEDGVHVTPYGYEFRAHLFATAISECPGGSAPVNEFGGQSRLPPPATAGVQPAEPAQPAPPRLVFRPRALIAGAGSAVAGLVIGAIDRLGAVVHEIP